MQELNPRHQRRDGAAHGFRAEKQRLMQATRVQKAVGKHVAALGIGAKLDLVNREEIGAHPSRHRLDRADPILDPIGHNPLFARDQRDHRGPPQSDDPVIDLARQKPQRQADDARAVREHPLDRVMGLAGIGRPQNGGYPGRREHIWPEFERGSVAESFRGGAERSRTGAGFPQISSQSAKFSRNHQNSHSFRHGKFETRIRIRHILGASSWRRETAPFPM